MKFNARELLLTFGEAKAPYRAAWRLIEFQLPEPTTEEIASFSFALNRQTGLTPRAVLDKFAAYSDARCALPDDRRAYLILSRYTHPEPKSNKAEGLLV